MNDSFVLNPLDQEFICGNILFLPVLHNRLEFAIWVNAVMRDAEFDCVAVEYPDTLTGPIETAIGRLPYLSVVHYTNSARDPVYLLVSPVSPLTEAGRQAMEKKVPFHCIDMDTDGYPEHKDPLPDTYAAKTLTCEGYLRLVRGALTKDDSQRDKKDILREMTMAYRLRQLSTRYQKIICVLGAYHWPAVAGYLKQPLTETLTRSFREGVCVSHLSEASSRECLPEPPFVCAAYEAARAKGAFDSLDRWVIFFDMLTACAASYNEKYHEKMNRGALSQTLHYAKKYAWVSGGLIPDLYQFLIAVRGCVHHDFAYTVWERAVDYPYQDPHPRFGVIELTAEELYGAARRILFKKKIDQRRRSLLRVMRKRPHERYAGEWLEKWRETINQCSHPPEDRVIENYAKDVMKKSERVLAERRRRVEEFRASLLDGIDIKETLRHWSEGKRFVYENQRVTGKSGALVMIFDDDPDDTRYPWRMTWQGEHDQESDMAFYATEPEDCLVGPGIGRAEYGGLVMTYPPGRMFDIFNDPYFSGAAHKTDVLIMAALDYCEESIVTFIAANPPPEWAKHLAGRMGKKIIYLPIGSLSPVMIRRVRAFHVLKGHDVREYADTFI